MAKKKAVKKATPRAAEATRSPGRKECPACNEIVGPRTRTCECGHVFIPNWVRCESGCGDGFGAYASTSPTHGVQISTYGGLRWPSCDWSFGADMLSKLLVGIHPQLISEYEWRISNSLEAEPSPLFHRQW